jgi:dUTP pyrophosphatase
MLFAQSNPSPSQSQLDNLLNVYDKYMCLKVFVDETNSLKQLYINSALNHNNKMLNPSNNYLDAGFDLFVPNEINCFNDRVNKIDLKIMCSAQMVTTHKKSNTGYYMYPRSSISKTQLRLANATGIIDAGYRGHLMGMFDVIGNDDSIYLVNQHDRLLQICAPGLIPIVVEVVDTLDELGSETERGSGGFGSTGR